MNAPENIKPGIAASLVRAQKAFAPALKTSSNPHFKSRYADLAACVEAVIDALNANGIFLQQNTYECDTGVIVETIFLHESGEERSCGKLHVPASKLDAQGYGSALTYARRYSLMAACGIAPEDDDGNAASKKKPDNEDIKKGMDVLQRLRAASMNGVASLKEAFSAEKDGIAAKVWVKHQASLMEAAKKADTSEVGM